MIFFKSNCRIRLLIALVLSVSSVLCPSHTRADSAIRPDGSLSFFDSEGKIQASIVIEIARSIEERTKGLMGRRALGDDEGMLFVYDEPGDRFFWMRDTYISLDIIFVSQDFRIIFIARKTKPLSEKRHWSHGPAKYVVEVTSGFSDRHGITEGTLINWRRNPE